MRTKMRDPAFACSWLKVATGLLPVYRLLLIHLRLCNQYISYIHPLEGGTFLSHERPNVVIDVGRFSNSFPM